MSIWIFGTVVMSPVFIAIAVRRNRRLVSRERSATVHLEVDPLGVRRVLADGREERVDWADVKEVEVLTARKGPHGRYGGVVILSCDEAHGCLVPLDQLDDSGVVEALTRLPGFDVRKLISAMEAKPPKLTRVW
jgi:hypothetical protein